MRNFCDLHTHSTFSDGTDTPTQLIRKAEQLELAAIALCDHNTVAGLPEFMAAAQGREVEAVPGVEFSADWQDRELHILGLFIRPEHYEAVTALLAESQQRKEQSNIELVHALNRAGYRLDYETVKAATPGGSVNRAHIAAALLEQGAVSSVKEAFQTLLSEKQGYYHRPPRLSAGQIISFIRSIGAVSVLAHPLLTLEEGTLRVFLSEAVPQGLQGLEAMYSTYDARTTALAHRLAEEYGIAVSGGSDYHGRTKPDITLGSGKGNLCIPSSYLERLKPR